MKIRGLNKAIKNTINYWLGPLLFLLLLAALFRQLHLQKNLTESWEQISTAYRHPLFWLAFILWILNWGLESEKWRLLLCHLEPAGFLTAFRAVLAGTSITMLTPNRTAEFAGRILFVSPENRLTAISLTFLGSMSQLLITLVAGLAGLLLLRIDWLSRISPQGLAYDLLGNFLLGITLLLIVAFLLIFFQVGRFVHWLGQFRIFNKIISHVNVLEGFTRKQLLRIVMLSGIRYMVFILQYLLLLQVFVPGIAVFDCLVLLMVFYLVMTAVPSIGLSELPLRAAASVEIFGLLTTNALGLQLAALSIWIINLLLPAAIGSLFLARVRLFGKYD